MWWRVISERLASSFKVFCRSTFSIVLERTCRLLATIPLFLSYSANLTFFSKSQPRVDDNGFCFATFGIFLSSFPAAPFSSRTLYIPTHLVYTLLEENGRSLKGQQERNIFVDKETSFCATIFLFGSSSCFCPLLPLIVLKASSLFYLFGAPIFRIHHVENLLYIASRGNVFLVLFNSLWSQR